MITTVERAYARIAVEKMSDLALMCYLRSEWEGDADRAPDSLEALLAEEVEVEALVRNLEELKALLSSRV